MRVGLVCPYSFDAHGGVQSHVRGLADTLVELGHDVRVLAPGEQCGDVPTYVTTTGRTVPMPYNGSVARVAFGPLVAARVRRWLADADLDVLHIHEPASPSVSVLALWAARSPVVATFHIAKPRSRSLETSAATFLRSGLGKIDAHVVVSEEARRTMARYVDVDPVVIPNGINVARYARPRADHDRGPTLAFVGRLDEPRKGFPILLRALPAIIHRHPDARLLVVGDGARRGLLRGVDDATAARVEILGAVVDDEKARVLSSADLLVAPNTHGESFGIVLVEAMAARASVVASDLPAFQRVLDAGQLGATFRTGDAADLSRAVFRVLDQPPRRRDLVVQRAAEAARQYDWRRIAGRLVEVYTRVAHDRQAPAGRAG